MLETCVWINGLLNRDSLAVSIINKIIDQQLTTVISSYIIAEIIAVTRRLARELRTSPTSIERDLWGMWLLPSVTCDFDKDISKSLLREVREQTEIQLLATILKLEIKDIPLIILAYKHNLPLITNDLRSLWTHREKILDLTGVKILLCQDGLNLLT